MIGKDKKETKISELGEFGLIKHLTQNISLKNSSSIKGAGDDAAVLNYEEKEIVVTTDLLLEGIHFNLVYTPLKHLGYKAAVVNFSDVYAMNAYPRQVTVSIAVSNKFSLESIEEIYSGIYLACERYNVDLIGGDTSSSVTGLTLSITAIGEIDKGRVVYRSTAQPNDLICVSGDLGAAYLGLQLLERERKLFEENSNVQPLLKGCEYLLKRQLKPEARKDIILLFKKLQMKPTSMIDISDGLASELLHICTSSNVGCKIFQDKIPIDNSAIDMAAELTLDHTICALHGGEDYELLFTISLNDFRKIENQPKISIIGHITNESDGINLITPDGNSVELNAQGWDALLKKTR